MRREGAAWKAVGDGWRSTRRPLSKAPWWASSAATDASGTTVTLEEVELPRLDREIVRMTRGFPIPVQYNGVWLRRPHAPDALPYVETAIGKVHLAGVEDDLVTREAAVYLQGLMIDGPALLGSPCNVVHLDSTRFRARLPDRDRLVDQEARLRQVQRVLRVMWRDRLIAAKQVAIPEVFAARFLRKAALWGHLDLFNDVPVLPEGVLMRVVGYPRRDANGRPDFLLPFRRPLARAEVERGRLRLACVAPFGDRSGARWMYARERAYLLLDAGAFAAGHWAQRYVRWLDDEPVSIEAVNPGPLESLDGRRIEVTVAACEAIEIRVGDDAVVIRDDAVYRAADNTILVPENENSGQGGSAGLELSSTATANGARTTSAPTPRHSRRRSRSCAAPNPAGALLRLIAEARPERYPGLRGKRFTVEVGETSREHRVAAEA